MALSFRDLVALVEEQGELVRITEPVDAKSEASALMQELDQQKKSYLFEEVKGSKFPLVGGLLNSLDRYGWVFGKTPGEPFHGEELRARLQHAQENMIAPVEVTNAPVKQNILTGGSINLADIPVPTFFEEDSGPYITAGCGVSRNPHTNGLNVGIYRTLVVDQRSLTVSATPASDLRRFYRAAQEAGESMPIALAIGVSPALMIAASYKLSVDLSEYEFAGAIQDKPVELVKCETSDLLVPADAEIIIEGRVNFSTSIENILGEYGGQYGPETSPLTEITAITHRDDALYYSIMAGRNPEHTTLASVVMLDIGHSIAEALITQLPPIVDIAVYLDPAYGSMAHVVIAIDKESDSDPENYLDAAFKATFNPTFTSGVNRLPINLITKRIVIVDADVDVHNLEDVEWAIWTRIGRSKKWRIMPEAASWSLEKCTKKDVGSVRLLVDATIDMEDQKKLRRPLVKGAKKVSLQHDASG